ncbi:hypothetical protein J2S48_003910 [Promicromonospora iranensis]|uniref:Uncharacterized protein n=2 Tax=Promicromonospora iranensis TaxID=1105144 RepID=A0ABU2CST2_9MICO|nr:hypothetical protein [Promicromonospora iranensis]
MKEPEMAVGAAEPSLEGIWLSQYKYRSSSRSADLVDEHYLVVHHQGERLVAQSLPLVSGSRVSLELALEPPIASGTWRETTAPNGHYQGMTYHGVLQLIIDPSERSMHGMWLGFGRRLTMNTGEWTLTWQEASTSAAAQ